jgi:hypothetical protein
LRTAAGRSGSGRPITAVLEEVLRNATGPHGPACVLCRGRRGPAAQLHLSHGVSVWLCQLHGGEEFLRRRGGKEFGERLVAYWLGGGSLTTRRLEAVRIFIDQVREAAVGRTLPGSYSWPRLREEAERRFALGDDPNTVIDELRSNYVDGPAMVPSVRTMRRWFTDARWRSARRRHTVSRRPPPSHPKPRRLRPSEGYLAMRRLALPWVGPWRDDP